VKLLAAICATVQAMVIYDRVLVPRLAREGGLPHPEPVPSSGAGSFLLGVLIGSAAD
jgi:hypothetical protein